MKTLAISGACLILLLQSASDCRAQFGGEEFNPSKMLERQTEAWSKQNRQMMELHLDELQRITGLPDKQLKKIRIGAKGQLNKHQREYKKLQETLLKKMQNADLAVMESIEKEAASLKKTYRNESWHSFLKKQLSAEQFAKVIEAQRSRDSRTRSLAMEAQSNEIADAMHLTNEQRAQMSKIIRKHMSNLLEDGPMGGMFIAMALGQNEEHQRLKKVVDPLVKKVLPKNKFEFWSKHLLPKLLNPGGMPVGGGMLDEMDGDAQGALPAEAQGVTE